VRFVQANNVKVAYYMGKNDLVPRGNAVHYLKVAALYPQRRSEMIARALQELPVCLSVVGSALLWPCQDRNVPWKVYYVGPHAESIHPWLVARLDCSLDATLGVLQQDLGRLSDMPFPHLICLQPAPMFPDGLWIVWTIHSALSREALDYLEEVRLTLEALIQVQSSEMRYFSSTSPLCDQALVEALGQGDSYALSALLSITRLVGKAEFTFWGRAYQNVVQCTDHMGAKQSGVGFAVPHGYGVGGRIAATGMPIVVDDYRNSPYRHPSVSDAADTEQIRSGICLPVRSRIGQKKGEGVVGILYTTRRIVKPFSLAEQLLVQRVTHLLEPLPPPTRSVSYFSPGLPPAQNQQVAWHKHVLHAHRIEGLEIWMSHFIEGTLIVTDSDGRPYVSARSQQLERLQVGFNSEMDGVEVISLSAAGASLPGKIYLCSSIALPPPEWPAFFTDLVMACNLVIERMEQAHDQRAYQREQWLRAVLQEESFPSMRQDGSRLGLPFGEGQLWVIAWPSQKLLTRQAARQRMLAEDIVLDQLRGWLLFLGDDIGVILLNKDSKPEPSKLHEALLALLAPHPLWIIYGARYHSLRNLKMVLTGSISLAQKARHEACSEYLLNIHASLP